LLKAFPINPPKPLKAPDNSPTNDCIFSDCSSKGVAMSGTISVVVKEIGMSENVGGFFDSTISVESVTTFFADSFLSVFCNSNLFIMSSSRVIDSFLASFPSFILSVFASVKVAPLVISSLILF